LAEDSPATFEPLFRAQWPDADSKGAAQRADDATAAVLRLVQSRWFFARLIVASIVLHLAAVAALVWLEHAPPLKPDAAQEIPVDLVTAPPDEKPSGAPQASPDGAKSAAPKPVTASAPKPEAAKPDAPKPPPPAPKPAPKPAPPKPEAPKPAPPKPQPPKPEPPKPEPPKPAVAKPAETAKPAAAKPPPVAQPVVPKPIPPVQPPPTPAPAPTAPPVAPSGSPEGRHDGLMQDNSRVVTMPQPSADGDEIVNYQTLVFGMLALKKQFPEDAQRRGVSGTARVTFELNDDGSVKSEKLLDSSGDAALDVESLAVVQRAAPFPKPPPGAQKVFAVDIIFGTSK
jgi:periplasmic protein TonB